jgi:hypothetical protein
MRSSAVLILPADRRESGNQLAIALGHDVPPGNTYNIPFSTIGGDGSPTHYGTHTLVTDGFKQTIIDAKAGSYPAWPPELLALAQDVVPHLITSFKGVDDMPAPDHVNEVLATHGLEMPEPN